MILCPMSGINLANARHARPRWRVGLTHDRPPKPWRDRAGTLSLMPEAVAAIATFPRSRAVHILPTQPAAIRQGEP